MNKIPVVAVIGPTASGKTTLAVEICKHFNGEAVSADSMQIYKGMDIATAKPSKEEMQGITHHCMDFLDNTVNFSVADYQQKASQCIEKIHSSGKLPVVVGGTGLYVDTLLNNVKLSENSFNPELREKIFARLESEGAAALIEEYGKIDSAYAKKLHENNRKRIVRAFEVWYSTGKTMTEQIELSKRESPYNVCYIGLDAKNRDYLYDRINRRVDLMLEAGLVEEAREYLSKENASTSAQAIGHKELKPYLDGEISLDEASENLKQATRRYAKRQLTWFRRNECINWLYIDNYQSENGLFEDAFSLIERGLHNEKEE